MKLKSAEAILAVTEPHELFTMHLKSLEAEKDEYLAKFRPEPYNTVRNFMITQKVTMLYRQALKILNDRNTSSTSDFVLTFNDTSGNSYHFECREYVSNIGVGKMYVSDESIILVISNKHESYYNNYIEKVSNFTKLDKGVWTVTEHMLPKVQKHFKTTAGDFVIILKKITPHIYPLREILNYTNGKLSPELVASILTRLYFFACYMDVLGMSHNAITLDNLFFAPGRFTEKNSDFTVDDMRIVGVYGGWFFSTWHNEKIKGLPKDVNEILPVNIKNNKISSYVVDMLSIKRIARELLGDASGTSLSGIVKEPLLNWVTTSFVHENAYEEYKAYDEVLLHTFGTRRFVPLDISID